MTDDGDEEPTPVAHEGDARALRRDPAARDAGRAGELPAGSLHAPGAGDARAPLAGGEARRPRAAVPGGGGANGRLDRDGDAGGALAAPRRGRLPAGARSLLKVALPVKG